MVATPNRGYTLQSTGSNVNTWGVVLNSILSIIDSNLGATVALDVSGNSNVVLTSSQAQNLIHRPHGTLTGNIEYEFPAAGGFFYISNETDGNFTLTVTVTGGSGGFLVPQGTVASIFIDGNGLTVNGATGTQYTYIAGPVAGTADAVTVPVTFPTEFSLQNGVSITVSFNPLTPNTGPITLNVASSGDIPVKKLSPSGLIDYDTGDTLVSPCVLQYNEALNVWVALSVIYYAPIITESSNFALAIANLFQPIICDAALTVTLDASATYLFSYFYCDIFAEGGDVTLTPDSGDSIQGGAAGASYVIPQGASARLFTDAAGSWWLFFMGPRLNKQATIASATTTDLGTSASNIVSISGTTTITSFGSSASVGNPLYFLTFEDALLLTYNGTSLILPTGANVTTAAGDTCVAQYLGSGNWKIVSYSRASGSPLGGAGVVRGSISGFLPSSIAGTSTTASLTVSAGQAANSTAATYITKNTTTSWAVSNGNAINGYQGGTTLPNGSTIHFFICSGASGVGTFAHNGLTPTLPAGYDTYYRRIFSLRTNGSGALIAGSSIEGEGGSQVFYLTTPSLDVNGSTPGNASRTLYALAIPNGIAIEPLFRANSVNAAGAGEMIITSPLESDIAPDAGTSGNYYAYFTAAPGFDTTGSSTGSSIAANGRIVTNNQQIGVRQRSGGTRAFYWVTRGWVDYRRS